MTAAEAGGPATPRQGAVPAPRRGSTWWSRRSLRARLTAAASVMIGAGMVAAAVLLVWWVHGSLVAGLDATVTQQVQQVASQAEHGPLPRPVPDAGEGSPIVQVVGADGRVVAETERLSHLVDDLLALARLDHARSRDAGGAGLGLAIVRDVVVGHGGQVRIEDNHPGARFVITLPAAP